MSAPTTGRKDGVPNGHSARRSLKTVGRNHENQACGHYTVCQGKNIDKPAAAPGLPAIITGAGEVLTVTPAAFLAFARLVAPLAVIRESV